MDKKLEIRESLANKILQYLGTKPYVEVYKIVEELMKLKEVKEAKEKDAETSV